MTFPVIRMTGGLVARAQREARGLCAERPDKGRGRPRMRAAAPGAIAQAIAQESDCRKAISAGDLPAQCIRFFLAGRKAAERSGAAFRPAMRSSAQTFRA